MDFPNYENGWATNPSESLWPNLWDKLVLCLEPAIGNQGNRCWDFSGKGHHGVLTSGPTWVGGNQGYAVDLDGTDDTVVVPHHPDFAANDNVITVMVWVKADAWGSAPIVWKGLSATGTFTYARWTITPLAGTNIHFLASDNGTSWGVVINPTIPSVDEWHHLCAIMDLSGARLLVDCLETNTTTPGPITMAASTDDIVVGRGVSDPGGSQVDGYFNGRWRDLRVYNRALSRQEVYDSFCFASPLTRNSYPLKQRGIFNASATFSNTLTITAALTKGVGRTFSMGLSFAMSLMTAISKFLREPPSRTVVDVKHTQRTLYS